MIPVPGLDALVCQWVEIRGEGLILHGFLLFTASDHFFPEYLEGDGLLDLGMWAGSDCTLFVVQSPSAQWIEYARATDHAWWRLFGQAADFDDVDVEFLEGMGNVAVLEVAGKTNTIREVFAPRLNQFQHADEIAKILHRFDLQATEHPCLVLFKDLKDRAIWFVDLRDLVDVRERELRRSLQQWFGGSDFKALLEEARRA